MLDFMEKFRSNQTLMPFVALLLTRTHSFARAA